MSLVEPSNGLLETHVTWQDVELEMQKALGTTARFGENKKATNISELKGFMSRIAMIQPDWVGVPQPEIDHLPARFAVKIPSQLALLKLAETYGFSEEKLRAMGPLARSIHNREVGSYEMLKKLDNPKIPITKIYAMKRFDETNQLKGFIISEFIPDILNITMAHSIPYVDIIPFVEALGALSSAGEILDKTDLEFAGGSDYLEMLFTEVYDKETLTKNSERLRNYYSAEYPDKIEKVTDLLENVYSNTEMVKKYSKISEYLKMKDVVCHCDAWSSNFLFTKEENERIVLKAVVDWQATHICNPAVDIARIMMACMTSEDRTTHTDELLHIYYNSLLNELDNKPAPYTFQQLVDSFNLQLPIISLLVIPGILPFMAESYSEEIQELARDKVFGLVEAVLKAHDYNLKHFPDFIEV